MKSLKTVTIIENLYISLIISIHNTVEGRLLKPLLTE